MYRTRALTIAAIFSLGVPTLAQHGPPADLSQLARGADRVVIATVTRVEPMYAVNEHGDELIVTRAHVRVDRVLKNGRQPEGEALVVEIEGGTVGDVTLDVSDLPRLERGERAVLFLGRDRRGANVPHGRGQGILKLDSADRVKGTGLSLAAVRAAVERGR